ncbi:adenylate/guanylate cyclase domain-containing protein [Flavihumibacter fluvii]|uniref:adenylate/guanylate cyclase domain-containing protein n=1 Tax=Flavihumibacter fluvii TaxID=2838157 RepID=UPI001BDEB218|nr:adenylate/guanylate cyclase domain-containing protein [Flavihumibacter fluvii]ULQ53219.1 adenylate/guanylate cyclase domain-containing protein [Flavihumibacter fluvii]
MEEKAAIKVPGIKEGHTNIVTKFRQFIKWIGSVGYAPGDSAEIRSHKAIITIALYVCILNLVAFFPVYIKLGRINAAITLLACAAFLTLNIILLSFHRNFRIYREITFISVYCYIIIYHTVMGGYIGSTGYIFYGIAVLNGVQIFYKTNTQKNTWFVIYVITAIVLFFLEPVISKGMVPLSDELNTVMFVNNFILISGIVMLSVNYFISIIRKEKLKADILIRNILPASVVDQLNTQGKSNPIMVPSATAIFMDFVGFTRITHKMEAQELVSILNEHFTNFDKIFRSHKVEKLKTIGDGYMAVGGLPETNLTHPLDVALAAMQILLYMENKNKNKEIDWNIRIGIHTGPMVAGIIGETKFSYDVWGSSVNLCSRLETASKPGFINVSHEFMECTRDFFDFEARGLVDIKNSEPARMYFLTDIREPLRSGHFQPNSRFYALYEQYSGTAAQPVTF